MSRARATCDSAEVRSPLLAGAGRHADRPEVSRAAVERRRSRWPGEEEVAIRPQASAMRIEDRIVESDTARIATYRVEAGDSREVRLSHRGESSALNTSVASPVMNTRSLVWS